MKTATSANSASVESRRVWVLRASDSWNRSQVMPDALAQSPEGSPAAPSAHKIAYSTQGEGYVCQTCGITTQDRSTALHHKATGDSDVPASTIKETGK